MEISEELLKKYKLSDEEHKKIGDFINKMMFLDKKVEESPIAIIDIAPPGSGKTGLNGYALQQFQDDNLIIINNDELRPFHPQAKEIAKLFPQYYTKITNEESKHWTDSLVDKAIEGRYNFLYEGTGRKLEIYKRMISKMNGYTIIVRTMAVSDLNCLMSIFERYQSQLHRKGWGRLVSLETFYKAYNQETMDTINYLEENHLVNKIEVYMRGTLPTNPTRVYDSDDVNNKFPNAELAILNSREKDMKLACQYFETIFNKLEKSIETDEEKEIIQKLKDLYKSFNDRER